MPDRRALLPALALLLVPAVSGAQQRPAGVADRDTEDTPLTECSDLAREAWEAVGEAHWDPEVGGSGAAALEAAARAAACRHADSLDQVRALLATLDDPAVRVVPAADVPAFLAEMTGQPHTGLGLRELLSLDVSPRTGLVTVITPVPGGPAARAGIRTGDVLESVDGVRVDTMDLALVMARIRGPVGREVRLGVRRDGRIVPVSLRIDSFAGSRPVGVRVAAAEGGTPIAYLRLEDFAEGTGARLADALERAAAGGAHGLVLDLRDNPGGVVPGLVGAAELFLPEGRPIARLRARPGADTVFVTSAGSATDLPLVVLVNGGTASAAEALAGALQANRRAVVVGEPTARKGLAHTGNPLSDGSLLLVPGGRLQTPHGRDVFAEGIQPDILAEAPSPLGTRSEWRGAEAEGAEPADDARTERADPADGADPAFRLAAHLLETSLPRTGPPPATDSAAIVRTALDYIEGWFDGDAERMRRAVHPDLVKRIVRRDGWRPATFGETDAETLVRGTAEGHGRSVPAEVAWTDVRILDIFGNAASVRIDAGAWIDYLHLARTESGWRIVNVLWEMRGPDGGR